MTLTPKRLDRLLVLDIDQTLVHGTEAPLAREADFCVGPYFIYKRPGVDEFMSSCLEWFEVGIWTASALDYAESVVAQLIGTVDQLAFLWGRGRCTRRFDPVRREEYYTKNLKKLKKRWPLGKIIAVDDIARNFEQSYGNLVHVRPYNGGPRDDELVLLAKYLLTLDDVEDVRSMDKRRWRASVF